MTVLVGVEPGPSRQCVSAYSSQWSRNNTGEREGLGVMGSHAWVRFWADELDMLNVSSHEVKAPHLTADVPV